MHTLGAERWQELAPHLERALDLDAAARQLLLASVRARDPQLAADLEGLLEEHRVLDAPPVRKGRS